MTGNPRTNVLETGDLRLVDERGRTRARLFLEDGEPKLTLYGNDDRKRAGIGMLPGGEVGLSLYDASGNLNFAVIVGAGGDPEISVRTRDGRERLLYPEPVPTSNITGDIMPHVKDKGLKWLLKK